MKATLIENIGNGQKAYNSIIVDPKNLGILTNELTQKIITELSENPGCALDLARRLEQHEQKIYYHVRKLEAAGIIKLLRTEKRYGMTAKIYGTSSPVVATKLYDDGQVLKNREPVRNPEMLKFLYPFINDGGLNAKVVIGDPNEHGRFDIKSKEGSYTMDFAILLGSFVNQYDFPFYKIDTEIRESELKENLILIGNIRTNVILDRMKNSLPIRFLEKERFSFISSKTNKMYTNPRMGFIIKTRNPLNTKKSIMAVGGLRTRGLRAAIVALTKNSHELFQNNENGPEFLRIVKGLDRKGDGIIDAVEFLE